MFTGLIVQDGTATDVPQSGTGSTSEGTQEDWEQGTPTTATDVPPSGTGWTPTTATDVLLGSTSRQDSQQYPPTTDDVTNKERDTSRRGFSEVILSVWSVWWGLPPSSLSAISYM